MIKVTRVRPDPPPRIRPVLDHEASAEIKAIYSELKTTLQVPWVGMITRAYARYPTFFSTLWKGLREVRASVPYVEAAMELRYKVERDVRALAPPSLGRTLRSIGYTEDEIRHLWEVFEIFSHGNNIYHPLVVTALVLLEGGELGSDQTSIERFSGSHAPDVGVELVFMEVHHGTPDIRALYDNIKEALGLPYVNSDYRALARWPSYLALAWQELKPVIGRPAYLAVVEAYHNRSVELCQELPNPGRLEGAALRRAATTDGSLEEVRDAVRLLIHNIPPLLVNMAFLRHQLLEETSPHADAPRRPTPKV